MEKNKFHIFSTFTLKVAAMIAMTFDHIGKAIQFFYLKGTLDLTKSLGVTSYVFQIIGRFTLPFIAICFAEAMRYTKSREDYLKRLGIMTMIVMIVEVIFQYALNMNWGTNIFLTILCSATFIYFYELKDNKKLLCVIPVLVILLSFANALVFNFSNASIDFLPSFLKADYNVFGFILLTGFYFLYKLSDYRVKELTGGNKSIEELRNYPYYRTFTNLMWIALLVALNVFFWVLSKIGSGKLMIFDTGLQCFSMIASIPIFFYSGKRGYKNNKTKYAFYFYYPIHLLIIILTFYFAVGL